MTWRYSGLSIILILITFAYRLPSLLPHSDPIPSSWTEPPSYDDPEGRLAMGLKLPLACADLWSLELLKGVSDRLALELIENRSAIIKAAADGSDLNAIQQAHGVGEKTAAQLLEYLDLTERCQVKEQFEIWKP